MRAFAEAWPDPDVIGQRFVGQLPWGQNITLLTKLKTREERLLYAARAVEHGWSRPLLTHLAAMTRWPRVWQEPADIAGVRDAGG